MRKFGILILTALTVAWPAHAQEREGLSLFVLGGGVHTFQKLNGGGTAYLGGGALFGAGLDWAPSSTPGLSVLGELAWTRHGLGGTQPGAGTQLDLVEAGLDLGWIFVNKEKVSSTLFGGGGGMLIHEPGITRLLPFSRLGLNAYYQVSPKVGLLIQATGTIYTISNFPSNSVLAGYDHHQGDGSIAAGVVLRL